MKPRSEDEDHLQEPFFDSNKWTSDSDISMFPVREVGSFL